MDLFRRHLNGSRRGGPRSAGMTGGVGLFELGDSTGKLAGPSERSGISMAKPAIRGSGCSDEERDASRFDRARPRRDAQIAAPTRRASTSTRDRDGLVAVQAGKRRQLADQAVADTGIGNVADKIIKNQRKTFGTLRDLMRARTVGIIEDDSGNGIVNMASRSASSPRLRRRPIPPPPRSTRR